VLSSAASPSAAQSSTEKVTVSSLLAQDYLVAGAVPAPSGGAGLFLRKDKKLYFCYVTETPKSATVTTDYCKPVE
jgi:hypothetical protein